MITNEALTQILERCEAATPGPWTAGTSGFPGNEAAENLYPSCWDFSNSLVCTAKPLHSRSNQKQATWEQERKNIAFIAAARKDVPRLVAEVERLRDAIARHQTRRYGTVSARDPIDANLYAAVAEAADSAK